jgi:hypothetical protein
MNQEDLKGDIRQIRREKGKLSAPSPKTVAVCPLTEAESKGFENRRLPARFQQHAGKQISDVPIDYLCYLTDPDPFIRELKRYLKGDRGLARIRDDE